MRTAAPADALWTLLADPALWVTWAPHLRAVERGPDRHGPVMPGEHLVVHGPSALRVDATVTRVDPGRRWDWEVRLPGPWTLLGVHAVLEEAPGRRVRVSMRVRGPLAPVADRTALAAYAPLADLALRRLATLAERDRARS